MKRTTVTTTAALGTLALALSACGSSGSSASSSASGSSGRATAGGEKPAVALLVASLSNSAVTALVDGAKESAKKEGATVDVLAADFDPQKQYSQMQDAITTGRYQGILVQSLDGSSICSLVPQAVSAGIAVGAVNSAIGTDFSSPKSSCDGVSASVVRPFATHGTVMGDLTVKACEQEKADPCKVAFLQTAPGAPFDTAITDAFTRATSADEAVTVVAQADSQASREGGLKALQQIVTAHPDLDVVAGPEQALIGGEPALAGVEPAPLLVGIGGTTQGVKMIEDGTLFGVSASVPASEGREAMKDLLQAISTGTPVPGHDAAADLPGGGVLTKATVGGFTPEFDG